MYEGGPTSPRYISLREAQTGCIGLKQLDAMIYDVEVG